MVLKTRTGVTRSSHPSPPPPFSPRATCFHHHDPRGVCQSQALVLRKAPGSSHGLINATKVTVPRPSLVHQRGGGTSFFVFFPKFSPIEKTRCRTKELILEIGLGRIKRGESRHVRSRFWILHQDFFSRGYHAASRSPRKRTPGGGGPTKIAKKREFPALSLLRFPFFWQFCCPIFHSNILGIVWFLIDRSSLLRKIPDRQLMSENINFNSFSNISGLAHDPWR